jgi:hypothetical protein
MAEANVVEGTMRRQGQRGEGSHEEYMIFYYKAIKNFVDFKKWCYKDITLGSQRNINGVSKMVRAYEFLDLVYKKTVVGSRGSVFNDADKNTYSLRVKFIKKKIDKELCSKCALNRFEIEQPCIFFYCDCGDFICGKCYAELLEVFIMFIILNFIFKF